MKQHWLIKILVGALCLFPLGALADYLDHGFGNGKGWVAHSAPGAIRNFDDTATAMLRQSDGKIVLLGQGQNNQIQLARYNTDGSLDNSFGTNGQLFSDKIFFTAYGNAITQQSDGKLVIVGWTPDAIGQVMPSLLRLNNDGSVDNSFGVKGVRQFLPPGFTSTGVFQSGFGAVIQQADGKLVAVGSQNPNIFIEGDERAILVRFNLDGTVDSSFGTDGIFVTPMKGGGSVIQQADGKLVVAGAHAEDPSHPVMSALRVTSAGALDTTFNATGFFISDVVAGFAQAVVQQADGRLVIAGGPQGADVALIRLNANGSLDSSFDGDGKVFVEFGGNSDANPIAMLVDENNKLVVAGWVSLDPGFTPTQAMLLRFDTDGSLDNSFGSSGIVTADLDNGSYGFALSRQPDGKLVVGGQSYYDEVRSTDFYLSRYNADGSLDGSFGDAGVVLTNFRGPDDTAAAEALLQQSNDKLVAAGKLFDINNAPQFGLVRFNFDGTLDTTFNGTGDVVTPIGVESYLTDLIQQSDGKLVAAGDTIVDHVEYQRHLALARYNLDGTLDTSFGGTGIVTAVLGDDAPSDNRLVESVIQQADGKIVAAGKAHYYDIDNPDVHIYDFALARYNNNGSLDTTFGGSGIVITDLGDWDEAYQVIQQSDGKLVAVGGTHNGVNSDFAIVRYNNDGSLDAGFGGDGIVVTDFAPSTYVEDQAEAVVQQADGKLVVAGGYDHLKLARYNVDGSLDATFGSGGKVVGAYVPMNALDVKKVVLLPAGKIMVIATDYDFFGRTFLVLTRYTASGQQELSFSNSASVNDFSSSMAFSAAGDISGSMMGGDGAFKLNLNTEFSKTDMRTARLQDDGKLIVAGKSTIADGNAFGNVFVARFDLSADTDTDGIPDIEDPDDDNDGMLDTWEIQYGLNPLDPSDAAGDLDGDSVSNLDEHTNGTDPTVPEATNKAVNDFNADGQSDVLFLNNGTGGTQYWSGAVKAATTYPGAYDLNYSYKGAGDFDGDGSADLFFTRASNNGTLVWNGAVKSSPSYPGTSTSGFSVAALCDINGDGSDDVFWYNATTGGTQIWPSAVKAAVTYPGAQSTTYSVVACGDFDGDGSADIFWRNGASGANQVWLGGSKSNKSYPGAYTDLTWTVIGAGDTNANTNVDLLWYKSSTGATQIWEGGLKSAATYPGANSTSFTPKAIGDYDGNGTADLLWSNNTTLGTQIWPGVVKASVTYPGAHTSGFVIQK